MTLTPIPSLPAEVKYALTVPQSVLFADLSLRGSLLPVFSRAMGIEYEPDVIVIDQGAMSWNFDADSKFNAALLGGESPYYGLNEFIHVMGATGRSLLRVASVTSSSIRRRGNNNDLLADLLAYWRAYEDHMTSLFTFWNVEALLSEALSNSLKNAGLDGEIADGLARFLKPKETNYFVLERRVLKRIATRFLTSDLDRNMNPSDELEAALKSYVKQFGFLLAPFNLGDPPSAEEALHRLLESHEEGDSKHERLDVALTDFSLDRFADLPLELRRLGQLAQRLTYWKTERLDVFAQADANARSLYASTAEALSLSLEQLFAMRVREIEQSLVAGIPVIESRVIQERLEGYCLILDKGTIGFYAPSDQVGGEISRDEAVVVGTQLMGVGASPGLIIGVVRVITSLDKLDTLAPGDVLVTTMTRPEMGAALDRASAFVTDEGGLMSHAAIISREMRKPCVIGTEYATRILKDGMTIEVNGDNGRIRVVDIPS